VSDGDREHVRRLFNTRSHSWREAGLARQLSRRAVKRARIQALVMVPLLVAILVVYDYRHELFGHDFDKPVQIVTTIVLIVLGWQIARDVGRALGPTLFRRLDPGTAGTVGFLIRLVFVGIAIIVALRIAGLDPRTLAVGGAFTAVIVGLAAQQTLGNLIAGTVLLSARPFRVGERVRLQGGGIAGQIEGVVSSLGLLYTTFSQGDDQVMVPNSVVLNVAIVPLREPDSVDLRARLNAEVTPARGPGAARAPDRDPGPRPPAHHAGGDRRRRGRRADLRDARAALRRPEAGQRGARGGRRPHGSRLAHQRVIGARGERGAVRSLDRLALADPVLEAAEHRLDLAPLGGQARGGAVGSVAPRAPAVDDQQAVGKIGAQPAGSVHGARHVAGRVVLRAADVDDRVRSDAHTQVAGDVGAVGLEGEAPREVRVGLLGARRRDA